VTRVSEPSTSTEPPGVAGEAATLRGFLDHHRDILRRKSGGLDAAQLAAVLAPSDLTLGGMLKHLAYVEEYWCREVLMGRDAVEPWAGAPWDQDADWEWHSAGEQSPYELRALYDETVTACDGLLDEALADGGPDRLTVRAVRGYDAPVTLRWVLVHLVEEYARHNGHADLIRQSIDGSRGH